MTGSRGSPSPASSRPSGRPPSARPPVAASRWPAAGPGGGKPVSRAVPASGRLRSA